MLLRMLPLHHLHEKRNSEPDKIPKNAIINGYMIGPTPLCLQTLNEVELALISPARTNKHVFSFTAGSHKSIKGWHSLYYNDLKAVNGVINWCLSATGQADSALPNHGEQQSEDTGQNIAARWTELFDHDMDDSDDDNVSDVVNDIQDNNSGISDNMNENDDTDQPPLNSNESPLLPQIAVVLTGPFTPTQKALTRQRTNVRWNLVKKALQWLKQHNHLYHDFDLPPEHLVKPIVIDKSDDAPASTSNVEQVFEITAVFPDSDEPQQKNGGFSSQDDLKQMTLDRLLADHDNKDATSIS